MFPPSSRIGIALGDVTGVGPEVVLKALAAEASEDSSRYLLIGDAGLLHNLNGSLGLALPLVDEAPGCESARFVIGRACREALSAGLPAGSPVAANAAVDWLREGTRRCLAGELAALVTAPVSKESIIRAGFPGFVGQTEFLSELARARRSGMMLLGTDDRGRWLRVALATTHVPIRLLAQSLTASKIREVIELSAVACRDLGLARQRIGVCGLNPHAGEGGRLGTEEQDIIRPAVESCRAAGLDVHGPFAADTLFHQAYQGAYDVVVAMYHDQGLAPLKMVAFDSGVNWTLGLPFIRTSPDHGTAYDIAGRGLANPSSTRAAIRLARELASRQGG